MRRAFAFLFFAAVCLADTTVTDTLCGANRAVVSWTHLDINDAQIGRSAQVSWTSGSYSESFQPGTDGSRYFVTISCPSGGSGYVGYWLIPDTVSVLTVAKVAVAANVKITAGWYWDSSALLWKNVAGGISGGGGGGVPPSRTITAGAGLTGGGDLSADRTIALATPVSLANGGFGASNASVSAALNLILPTQAGHNGEFLSTNGTTTSWLAGGVSGVASITAGPLSALTFGAGTGAVTGEVTSIVELNTNSNAIPGFKWYTPTGSQAITGVGSTINANGNNLQIDPNAAYVSTAAPLISDPAGGDGKRITITNVDTVFGFTIQDNSVVASNFKLCSLALAIGPQEAYSFVFNQALSLWVEEGCRGSGIWVTSMASPVTAAGTFFFGASGGGAGASEAGRSIALGLGGTMQSCYGTVIVAPQPATGAIVYTLRKNAADTAITFTVPLSSAVGDTFSDTTHAVTIAASDKIAWKAVNAASANSSQIAISCELAK